MRVELRHIRAFHAVAKELNFRRASENLGIAQPALSRTIKELEECIRTRLLERTTRVVRLTDSGRIFAERTAHLIGELENAVHLTQLVQSGVAGKLRVGFNDHAINGLLPEMVRRFRADSPDVEVALVDGTTLELTEMALDGEIDVAFCTDQYSHPDLDVMTVRKERVVCVLPASHPLAEAETISITDLSGEPFIMGRWEMWKSFNRRIQEFCGAHGFVPNIVQEAEHSDGIIGLVAAGMGVTLSVDCTWIRALKEVAIRPLREQPPKYHTIATWRRDRRSASPVVDKFVQTANDVVGDRGYSPETG